MLYLNYATEHIFDNSFIVINYRFRNVLWYRFGKHKTLEKQIKIFNLKNFDTEFDLVVYGFFQRKVYKLKFEPQLTLNSSAFKTAFANLILKLEEQTIPELGHPPIYCARTKPILEIPQVKQEQITIKISNAIFNQNEFI